MTWTKKIKKEQIEDFISDATQTALDNNDVRTLTLTSSISTTSTSAVNTNLSVPIGANEKLKFIVDIQGTTSSGGIFYQPTVPSGAVVTGGLMATNTTSFSFRILTLTANTLTAIATSTSAGVFITQLAFTVRNGSTAGNVILSFASGTGGNTTIEADSSMTVFKTENV
jgi:hypothetical protein